MPGSRPHGSSSAGGPEPPTPRERARTVGRALALGGGLAAAGVVALVLTGERLRAASSTVFALGALVFGFSLLGWSGSVFAGAAVESLQDHLGGPVAWTEADSRRAMVVLGSVGLGGMVGASITTAAVGALL